VIRSLPCLFLALTCLSESVLRADVVVLRPVADTTLFSANPANNLGASDTLAVGGTAHFQPARGLVRFDLNGVLPAGATLSAVRLSFAVTKGPPGGVASTFEAHRMLKSWVEGVGSGNTGDPAVAGESTWASRVHPGEAWGAPGGAPGRDYAGATSAAVPVNNLGRYVLEGAGLLSDVQSWRADPASNQGWILISSAEDDAATARRVGTRENPGNEPLLTLEYTAPPRPEFLSWGRSGDRFEMVVRGDAGNLYEVQYRDLSAVSAPWQVLTNFVVKLVSTNVTVSEPVAVSPGRAYRIAITGQVD